MMVMVIVVVVVMVMVVIATVTVLNSVIRLRHCPTKVSRHQNN